MARNLQSPPNLFCVIWTKPHKTELGGIASFYLQQRLINALNFLPTKKLLHCLCTATSETQFCKYGTLTLQQVLVKSAC